MIYYNKGSQSTISHAFRLLEMERKAQEPAPNGVTKTCSIPPADEPTYETLSPREAHWAQFY